MRSMLFVLARQNPMRLLACNINKTIRKANRAFTTLPSQGHSVDCCSGRKNRLMGGIFIFVRRPLDWKVFRVKSVFLTIAKSIHLSLPLIRAISYTTSNTTATLSACIGNAQPWRFFYATCSHSTGAWRA